MNPSSIFKGEAPGFAADKFTEGGAQLAVECKLVNGNLAAWKDLGPPLVLAKGGVINSLFPMDPDSSSGGPFWLHWNAADLGAGQVFVDAVKGLIADDTADRVYFTGCAEPRVTTRAMATDPPIVGAAGAYPYAWLKLGVPSPSAAPIVSIVPPAPGVPGALKAGNAGAELGTMLYWTTLEGSPAIYTSGDIVGFDAFAGEKAFSGGTANVTESYQNILLPTGVLLPSKMDITWQVARGPNGSNAGIGYQFYDADNDPVGGKTVSMSSGAYTNYAWVAKSLIDQPVPKTARSVRIFQRFEKVGAGTNDAFIDEIAPSISESVFTSDGSSMDEWLISASGGAGAEAGGDGFPSPGLRLVSNNGGVAAIYQNFNADDSDSAAIDFDASERKNNGDYAVIDVPLLVDQDGNGKALKFDASGVSLVTVAGWTAASTAPTLLVAGDYSATEFSVSLTITKTAPSTYSVVGATARIDNGAAIAAIPATTITSSGPFIGFRAKSTSGGHDRAAAIDNVRIAVDGVVNASVDETVATSYVSTFVNQLGDESAPSPPTETIIKAVEATIDITTETSAPAGYGVTLKRIYRRASGSDEGAFLLVEEIPLAQAVYSDAKADSLLGEEMEPTAEWTLPPTDMHSIIVMANGITAAASKNSLLLSPIWRMHAFPESYRLSTDYRIVALGVVDTDIIVMTTAGIYVATGSDPANFSMAKIEYPQGCVSKRSVASMPGFGVVYASPDGLIAIGRGAPRIITEGVWTQEAWTAINPSSLVGVVHDSRYYGFYQGGAFVFDPRQPDRGVAKLDLSVDATYHESFSDRLYLAVSGGLVQWEGAATRRRYVYREKVNLVSRPLNLACAEIRAVDYSDLTFRLYYDDVLVQETAVTSEEEFLLQGNVSAKYSWYRELEGSSEVRGWQVSDDMGTL